MQNPTQAETKLVRATRNTKTNGLKIYIPSRLAQYIDATHGTRVKLIPTTHQGKPAIIIQKHSPPPPWDLNPPWDIDPPQGGEQ